MESNDLAIVREALNRHGVFLKKRVLSELHLVGGMEVMGEEIGRTFGETRVADIVTREQFRDNQELRLVLECKRVDPDRRWIFFPHTDRQHRVSRSVDANGSRSDFYRPLPRDRYVCSEGFEFPTKSRAESPTAEQDPVFKAAAQLTAAYLGLLQAHLFQRGSISPTLPPDVVIKYAPVLITTAKLCVAKTSWSEIPLESGRIEADTLELVEADNLVLKHPAPSPEGMEYDFRNDVEEEPWSQRFTESIYVVQAAKLRDFLSAEDREFMAFV